MSGGLDSALAVQLIKNQGIEVHAIYCAMPWGCGKKETAQAIAEQIGVQLYIVELGEDYIDLLKKSSLWLRHCL